MHISEGILSVPVLAAGWVVSAGLLTFSLRRTTSQMMPKMAVFASAFFLASLIRVPIGASSAHFALLGLMGMTLGWGAFIAIFISLALQALLFQFGGLLSLGVNGVIMGVPALLACLLFGNMAARAGISGKVAAFLAGFVPVAMAVGLVYLALLCSHAALATTARVLVVASTPLMVLEGLVTLFAVVFLQRVAPDMLATPHKGTCRVPA